LPSLITSGKEISLLYSWFRVSFPCFYGCDIRRWTSNSLLYQRAYYAKCLHCVYLHETQYIFGQFSHFDNCLSWSNHWWNLVRQNYIVETGTPSLVEVNAVVE
jgi:hypothetical protein